MLATTKISLGRTNVSISRLGLGTAPLGGLYELLSDDAAEATVRAAIRRGLRFFDTAPLYGNGTAEVRLGRILNEVPRHTVVVSTKVGRLVRSGEPDISAAIDLSQEQGGTPLYRNHLGTHCVFDFSYDGAMRSIEESLRRLEIDSVDIVHVHDPYDHVDTAIHGACSALVDLRDQGVIGAVGLGIDHPDVATRFVREADIDCVLIAGRFTLLDQQAATELLPMCLERNIAVIAAGVFNSGILAAPERDPHFDYAPAPPAVVARAIRIGRTCARFGVPLRAAALQFPLRHPAVTSVVVGARRPEEIEENTNSFEIDIPAELWIAMADEHGLPPT
jgi:D-threo-aldose 1-dehydrogenase